MKLPLRIQAAVEGAPCSLGWRVENKAEPRAELYVYDAIGDWGKTAGDFVAELRDLDGHDLDLHVNSEGGSVFDGLAMFAALEAYEGDVRALIDGVAASTASFLVQAASSILIGRHASMFIHNARVGLVIGATSEDLRGLADLLDDATLNIAEVYAERSGKPLQGWLDAMRAETSYRGQAAVDAGLADDVIAAPSRAENKAGTPTRAPELAAVAAYQKLRFI